jgi:hypothetical protein
MINHQQARQIATEWLIAQRARGADGVFLELRILDEHTLEADFGWVFFYQSQRFLETGDFPGQLLGNAPLIVDRRDGTLHVTGTANPVEHYVHQYLQNRQPD